MRQEARLLEPRCCLPVVPDLGRKLPTRPHSRTGIRDVLPLARNNALHDVLVLAFFQVTCLAIQPHLPRLDPFVKKMFHGHDPAFVQQLIITDVLVAGASITSFCRYCRISFGFAQSSSWERFFTLTSTFLFLSWLATTLSGSIHFLKRLCCDALLVTSTPKRSARDSCFWDFLHTRCSACIGVFSTVCEIIVSPPRRARLNDELVWISNFRLTCRDSCSQAAVCSSSVLSSSGGASVGKFSYFLQRSHPSKPWWGPRQSLSLSHVRHLSCPVTRIHQLLR